MLEVTKICKSYRKKPILAGASFTAKPGTCTGIAGGNGCGKTTLLSIVAGVGRPDSGSVRFDGTEAVGNRKMFEKNVAYVPQENPFIPELSAGDNFKLWYRGDKKSMEADLKSGVAKTLGLPGFLNTAAGSLSGGQKKRLSIASALSNHASVLVLDEPGAALDLAAKEEILAYIKNFVAQGGTVVLTSHEMGELSLCDSLYILKDGVLVPCPADSAPEELIKMF